MGERDGLWLDVLTFLSSLTRLLGDGLLLAPAPLVAPTLDCCLLVGDLLLERPGVAPRRLACRETVVDEAFLGVL